MRRKVMLKEVISVVKLSLFPVWCWPLPQDATKFKIFCVKLHHYLCIILGLRLMVPLIYCITNYFDDPITLVNQILVLSSTSHAIANFIFEIVNYHRIQNVTFEMVYFCDLMKPHEEVVIQRYINKCIMFHSICLFFIYFPITIAIPALLHQPFPVVINYPFNISYQPVKTIIFIHQSMMAIMIAGQLCMNILMALLLWFTSARFEVLTEELRKITNVYQLFKCIKKHQELLKYAREVTIAARPFAFSTICCSTVCLILVFLLVIKRQSTAMICQFFGISIIGILEVFTYTWPAEHLMYMSKDVAEATFNMLENDHLIKIWKCLQIIIMRSQKPVTVSIPCLLPILSLNYFTSYLSTVLSYFTTLRVIMDD